jgi:hypothetical protein
VPDRCLRIEPHESPGAERQQQESGDREGSRSDLVVKPPRERCRHCGGQGLCQEHLAHPRRRQPADGLEEQRQEELGGEEADDTDVADDVRREEDRVLLAAAHRADGAVLRCSTIQRTMRAETPTARLASTVLEKRPSVRAEAAA